MPKSSPKGETFMTKTYVVEWSNKNRKGAWRNYRKVVETDNLEKFVREKMKLVVGCMAFGHYKGTFNSATEVVETQKFGYRFETRTGGEYWFTKDNKVVQGTAKWHYHYDYKLHGWLTHA